MNEEEEKQRIIHTVPEDVQAAWEMKKVWKEGLSFYHTSKFSKPEYDEYLKEKINKAEKARKKPSEFDLYDPFPETFNGIGAHFGLVFLYIATTTPTRSLNQYSNLKFLGADYDRDLMSFKTTTTERDFILKNYVDFMQGTVLNWMQAWVYIFQDFTDEGTLSLKGISGELAGYIFAKICYTVNDIYRSINGRFGDYLKNKMRPGNAKTYERFIDECQDQTHIGYGLYKIVNGSANTPHELGVKEVLDLIRKFFGHLNMLADFNDFKPGSTMDESPMDTSQTCMRCGVYIKECI